MKRAEKNRRAARAELPASPPSPPPVIARAAFDEALAALAHLDGIITRTGGWMVPYDQELLRAARAVLARHRGGGR